MEGRVVKNWLNLAYVSSLWMFPMFPENFVQLRIFSPYKMSVLKERSKKVKSQDKSSRPKSTRLEKKSILNPYSARCCCCLWWPFGQFNVFISLLFCEPNTKKGVCIASMYIVTNCYIMTRLINCSSGKSTEFIQRSAFGSVVLLQ